MKSLVETVEVVGAVVVAVSLVVLEASSTMEEEAVGTATLLALAADRPTTGRPTTGVVVDQGTASRDKR